MRDEEREKTAGAERRKDAKAGTVQREEGQEAHPGLEGEPTLMVNDLSRRVIGAAIEVHRHLGPGFLEKVYEEALSLELELRGIRFQRQVTAYVSYKAVRVGQHQLDFLVEKSLVLELKAVEALADIHRAQVVSCLRAHGLGLGLLLNFNVPVMRRGIRRVLAPRAQRPF